MTTLVTGAGLLGTSFAAAAKARGETIVFYDPEPRSEFLRLKLGDQGYRLVRSDIRNLADLVEAMQAHRVHTVVHTAGLIGGRVQREISHAFDVNVGGTRNVAEAVRLTGVKRLVHLSTFGAYDWRRPMTGPITEAFPLGPGRAYGNFKAAKELILEAYALQYKFELLILRPANVFGLGHFWGGSSGGAKMHELMEAGIAGRPARIPANDTLDVEYVYSKDVGAAIDFAATVSMPKEHTFNIGTGRVTRFDELIADVRKIYPDLDIEIEPGGKATARSEPLDVSRAKRLLGWEPRFTLLDALKDYRDDLAAATNHA